VAPAEGQKSAPPQGQSPHEVPWAGYPRCVRIDFCSSRRTSLGVEWELELVDIETRELASAADDILAAISPNGDGEHPKAKHELL
jgi:hypothetical protein